MLKNSLTRLQFSALLTLLALGTLPALVRLPWLVSLVCLLPIAVHFIKPIMYRKITSLLLLLLLLLTIVLSFDSWFSGDAIIAFICTLLWLKSTEINSKRDVWILVFAVCVVMALNALFGIGLWQMLHLFVVICCLLFTMLCMQITSDQASIWQMIQRSFLYFVIALPLTAILFFMLPRVPGPLWDMGLAMGLPVKMVLEKKPTAAIEGTLKSGVVNSLQLDNSAVLVAEFEGAVPSKSLLYWRGAVFWDYDGERWSLPEKWSSRANLARQAVKGKAAREQAISEGSEMVRYKMRVSAHGGHWLYALDMPSLSAPETLLSKDYQLISIRKVNKEFTYNMASYLSYSATIPLTEKQQQRALTLPENSNPKIVQLGQELALDKSGKRLQSDNEIIAVASRWYANAGLTHSAKHSISADRNSLDQFLIEKKPGSAEHVAGSFVLLMRAAGIPARLVTGYRGGNIIALTNFVIVKQGHAHVWPEVWSSDKGWQRVEAKDFIMSVSHQAAAPKSVPEKKQAKQQPKKEVKKAPAVKKLSAQEQCQASWLCRWLQGAEHWIVEFDADKQLQAMNSLGLVKGTVGRLMLFTALSIVLLLLVYRAVTYYLARRKRCLRQLGYELFCKTMSKSGCERELNECPATYHQRLLVMFPQYEPQLQLLMKTYLDGQYGKATDKKSYLVMVKRFIGLSKLRD
ncbi:MAG: DUF3488 domain-containing transglutaminase family protein [Alteromonadales bacterium]|nr:DUF3488 domain-containing transglutaminase family protein [Alteromonadales bacterium]